MNLLLMCTMLLAPISVAQPAARPPTPRVKPPHAYTIKVVMNQRKPDGHYWDVLHGAPDPYIKVDGHSYRDKRCHNAYSCSFHVTTASMPVRVEVWDADVAHDDYAGSAVCRANRACSTGRGATVYILPERGGRPGGPGHQRAQHPRPGR